MFTVYGEKNVLLGLFTDSNKAWRFMCACEKKDPSQVYRVDYTKPLALAVPKVPPGQVFDDHRHFVYLDRNPTNVKERYNKKEVK